MKLKTTGSIIVTSIPFLSFPLSSKETKSPEHYHNPTSETLFFIFIFKKKKKAENYFIFKSLLLCFLCAVIFVYDHHGESQSLPGRMS